MSAGYIQLVALGQQDAYLSGEPQVTYFSGVYKRHTPFVLEAYDIPFNDQYITYGGTSICHIPPKGDLIRGLTLKMTLPALYNPGNDWVWPLAPSPSNVPKIWFGLTNGVTGSIVQVSGSFNVPYYSTNGYALWASSFFPTYGTYNANTNQFSFTYSSGATRLANVIVQSTSTSNNASSSIFWGLDPLGYSYTDTYGNLVYTATSNTVTPTYTLQQGGWVQTAGTAVNTLAGLYTSLIQSYAPGNGLNFINFNYTNGGVTYFYNNDSTGNYSISPAGCILFNVTGYYLVRAGFNIDVGSIQSLSYAVLSSDYSGIVPSSFNYTSNCTVSPSPSSPLVIPINVTASGQYYAFFASTTGTGNFLPGTYISATPANDFYQFANNITMTSGSKVPLYGNSSPQNNTVMLSPSSNISFSVNGEYLVTGLLSVSNAVTSNTTEVYVSNVTFGNATSSYTYDLSQQGRNPTYAFSIPVVASNTANYWVNVSTQSTTSNLLANSFFAVTQVGVQNDTNPGIVLPYNGTLLQSTSDTLTSPLNLKTQFSSNGNSTAWVTVNANGNLVFQNVSSYMLTGVFYTTNTVTNVIITNSKSNFLTYYNPTLGFSSSPPYTISVPFHISDNTASYGITLQTSTPTGTITTVGNVLSGTYLAVYPIASNIFSGTFGQIYNYYDGVGTLAIVNADLKIGGQTIQRLTGEYIEVWNELNVPYENQPGLQLLTGKYDTQTSVGPPGRTYYVNLPYYFYGNPELSLPITALGRQDVEVWVTFNNFSNLTSVSITNPTLTATIITEYVYLSNPEIDWFQSHRLDYVITQCQYEQFVLGQNFQSAIFDLKFKNPIKELFFLIHPNANLPYNYTTPGGGTDALTFGMTFNGEDAFLTSTINTLYVGAIEPFTTHTNFFSKPTMITAQQPNQYGRQFYMYSFSTNPFGTLSSGQINFSRIRQVLLEMNIKNSNLNYPSKTFNIIALSQNILRIENGIGGVMFR
jgi:hypothetical protein